MVNEMSPKIKLTVSDNELIRHLVTKPVEKYHLVKTLEEFQVEANAALTKMIEQLGEIEAIDDANMDDDDDDESIDEDTDESKGHSESKKKKQ